MGIAFGSSTRKEVAFESSLEALLVARGLSDEAQKISEKIPTSIPRSREAIENGDFQEGAGVQVVEGKTTKFDLTYLILTKIFPKKRAVRRIGKLTLNRNTRHFLRRRSRAPSVGNIVPAMTHERSAHARRASRT